MMAIHCTVVSAGRIAVYKLLMMTGSKSKHVAVSSDVLFEIELCLTDVF
jgi:hypothetical protein